MSGHRGGELTQVGVVDDCRDALGCARRIEVTYTDPELVEAARVEAWEAHLDGAGVVEARVGGEVRGEALRERG